MKKPGTTLPLRLLARARRRLVAQVSNLPYRRIEFGRALTSRWASKSPAPGGLQIRDTAEYKSALRGLPLLLLALLVAVTGCGKEPSATVEHGREAESHGEEAHTDGESHAESADAEDGHAGHAHGEEGGAEALGAEFEEGKGIQLAEPAREMIGLESALSSARS